MTSSAAMNIEFLHCANLPFLRYIHCNFCLNPHVTHGDMEENVSGSFLLNTVYTRLQIFIQLSTTLTKLCHTKRDHPANFYISLQR